MEAAVTGRNPGSVSHSVAWEHAGAAGAQTTNLSAVLLIAGS